VITLLKNLFCSSVGKKYIMAISGLVLFLFVTGHLIGNLQVFVGPEAINRYGDFLQHTMKEFLWPIRAVMLTLVVLHFWSASRLTLENRAARPVGYAQWNPTAASYASRTMFMSGLIIAFFIVYHILHYTALVQVGGVDLANADAFKTTVGGKEVHDIFKMLIVGFNKPLVSIFYVIAVGLISLHVCHGVEALFQSLGLKSPGYNKTVKCFANAIALFLFVGYSSIPVAILLGYGKEALK
jgi:succinate dehydrogenase / fumarate reductase cytochrome b subunit